MAGNGDVLPLSSSIISFVVKGTGDTSYYIVFNGDRKDITDELINQILSTFKFLDEEDPLLFNNRDLRQGWYWGQKDQKKANTPADWIYTDAGRSSCWHEPNTLCTFLPD